MNLRGTLPALILEALELHPDHGYSIAQRIKERSKGVLDFKEGTLYPALHKLEQEQSISSYEEVENGRTRRYYKITRQGRAALSKSREEWLKVSGAVSMILGEAKS
jgi:transcriptional regulator